VGLDAGYEVEISAAEGDAFSRRHVVVSGMKQRRAPTHVRSEVGGIESGRRSALDEVRERAVEAGTWGQLDGGPDHAGGSDATSKWVSFRV
jgi:hypothetical protein